MIHGSYVSLTRRGDNHISIHDFYEENAGRSLFGLVALNHELELGGRSRRGVYESDGGQHGT